MAEDDVIKSAYGRMRTVFQKRPEAAKNSIGGVAVITDGLRCEFTQGDHSAVMDLPGIMGGEGEGPTPGFFGRAAVAGCVSIGLKQLAAAEGIHVERLTVSVDTDFDDGASMGLGGNTAAPIETRVGIAFKSDADEAVLEALAARLLEQDPWFLALRDAQSVKTRVTVDR